jgi:hypothetical protein
MEIFQEGDALVDFSVFPDGSAMNGVQGNSGTDYELQMIE